MILERIAVSGFRAFAERLEFTPDARFTVIAAPNGTGKSTLLDALYFGLLERHSVSGVNAEQRFKAIGRDLTPTIEIEFAVSDVRYRLRKTFLTSAKSASLQRLEAGRYVAFQDGSAADDFVRGLFFADAPGRGALEPSRNLGLHHVLWSPARASFVSLPEGAGDEIRAMLGGAALAVTPGERAVHERVSAEYQRFFTDEGAFTARAGSANIPGLESRVRLARAAEVEAHQQYLRFERFSVDYADRAAEAERMSAVRSALRTEIETTQCNAAAYTALKAAAERAERDETEARVSFDSCASRIRELAGLRAECAVLTRERTIRSHELRESSTAAAVLSERFRLGRQAVEDAGAAVTEVQGRAAGVTAARSYADSTEAVGRLRTVVAAYDSAAAKLADLSAARAVIVAPARDDLEALREAAAELDALQTAIAASALALEIDAESDITVEVIAGEPTGAITLAAGSSTTFAATDVAVVIDVPGVGRIRARGTDGAAKARKRCRRSSKSVRRHGNASVPRRLWNSPCA